jgi:hypothetical protein
LVRIRNDRESGSDAAVARDVVPELELWDEHGKTKLSSHHGGWGEDSRGETPATVTFRPTREAHPLVLARKRFREEYFTLGGQTRPYGVGTYKLSAVLRGENLQKAARFEWALHNPGKNGELDIRGAR